MSDGRFPPPTPYERKILEWVRSVLQPTTRTITFHVRHGVIERGEAEERLPAELRINDVLREAENQDITIKRQDGKAAVVREAFDLVATGAYALEDVRRQLRTKGLTCSRNQFSNLLRNPIYAGRIRISAWRGEAEEEIEGLHDPIVSPATFRRVQDVLAALKSNRRGKPTRPTRRSPTGWLRLAQVGR